MKIRSDFVTNSSSSSFVIAYRRMPKVDKKTLEKYPWISCCMSMIEKTLTSCGDYVETTEGEICTSEDELEYEFIRRYGWGEEKTLDEVIGKDDEGMYEFYQKLLEYIQDGFSIIFKSIAYSDETYIKMLNDMADGANIIIIEGE